MKKKNEIYIYLARRDKEGVKFLGVFGHPSKIYPTKLTADKIPLLNMTPATTARVVKEASDNRMEYELYVETASSFEELKSSLFRRGYSRLPNHHFSPSLESGRLNERILITEKSTMARRSSDVR